MTTITASCPTCGDVRLEPLDVVLRVCTPVSRSHYVFRCPRCTEEVCKPADGYVISLLVASGAQVQEWEIPAEALERRGGPALDCDDVLDFVLALSAADDLPALAQAGRGRRLQ